MSVWRRIYIERKTVILPLAAFLVASVAVFAAVVVPLKRSVVSYDEAATSAGLRLVGARTLDRSAKDARTKKEQADRELKKFYAEILPVSLSAATSVANFRLQAIARESGLQVKSNQYEPEAIKDSPLARLKGRVTLTGDYMNIRRFLYALETAEEFVIIGRVELSQVSQLNNTGILEVTLDVETYYLAEPAAAGVGP